MTAHCRLPFGTCSRQGQVTQSDGAKKTICRDMSGVPSDWQIVELDNLPIDDVRGYMAADPVTAHETLGVREFARLMSESHIHRIIVVDEQGHPTGVVSASDLLSAVASAQNSETIESPCPAI